MKKSQGPLHGAFLRGILWDHRQEVTFSFRHQSGSENQREKTRVLVEECFLYTNLSVIWVEDGMGVVRISFDDDRDSSSYIGKQCHQAPRGCATTNLRSIDPNTTQPSPEEAFTILHECGHICGLVHEHQVPGRRGHFNFIESEVQNRFGPNGYRWSQEDIRENITRLHQRKHIENCSRFDRNSIMMYEFPASLTYEGVGAPLNKSLSDIDKAVLTLNYPRLEPHPEALNWTVSYAVDILGIDGEFRECIVAAKDPRDIRKYYTDWSTEQVGNGPVSGNGT
ncbi:hypothetical protein NLI96_g4372 [Meripilus lineatus]|uniref:Metalloendopeptidase n=1 Tax=Meripilus lineatus TaxID=2056292 RepID=A0AAD5YFS5_9APHY|nr:hypothetical protein NLI96_g4372 [Physisporinus lineatus]